MTIKDSRLKNMNPACTGNIYLDSCEGGAIYWVEMNGSAQGASQNEISNYVLDAHSGFGCARIDFVDVNRTNFWRNHATEPKEYRNSNSLFLPAKWLWIGLIVSVIILIVWEVL